MRLLSGAGVVVGKPIPVWWCRDLAAALSTFASFLTLALSVRLVAALAAPAVVGQLPLEALDVLLRVGQLVSEGGQVAPAAAG